MSIFKEQNSALLPKLEMNIGIKHEDSVLLNVSVFKQRFAILKNTSVYKKRYTNIKDIEFKEDELSFFEEIIKKSIESPMEYNYVYKELTLPIVSAWISKETTNLDEIVEKLKSLAMIINFNKDIASLVEYYVKENIQYLEAVMLTNDKKDIEILLLAFYRLIKFDKLKFLKFMKADLLSQIISGNEYSVVSKILAIKIYAYMVQMTEKIESAHLSKLKGSSLNGLIGKCDNIEEFDYEFIDLNEGNRLAWFSNLHQNAITKFESDLKINFPDSLLSTNVKMVYGKFVIHLEHLQTSDFKPKNTQNLIANASQLKPQIQSIIENFNSNKPTLITGSSGVGKTHIIQSLHKRLSQDPSSIISIHLGEQTDAKLLLGTYTSGSKPGTFEWKNGVLTTAIKEGKWVIVEDINKAPTEVLSVLLSLLENKCITIPSRGETVYCANGFQMIATITTNRDNSVNYKDLIGFRLWNEVQIPEIPDLMELLKWKSDEQLHQLLPNLVTVFEEVVRITSLPSFTSLNRGVVSRPVTVRDLVKLCDRLTILVENKTIDLKWMTSESYDIIFLETVSCFTSFVAEQTAVELLADSIGEILQIQPQRIKTLISSNYIPVLENDETTITIGRCQLQKNVINKQKKSINDTSFATTNHAKRLMEKVAVSIKNNEPLLLVGETGTGKTTVVQQVSKLLHKKLTVINVSQQTEASDLLGGYKPVNCRTLIVPIIDDFEELFPITFSMSKNEKFYNLFHKCVKKQHWPNVIKVLNQAFKMAENICMTSINELDVENEENVVVKKRKLNALQATDLLQQWQSFKKSYEIFEIQSQSLDKSFVFDFVEGSLVKAIKNGEWLLLDELNLATADTLENIADLLNDDPENRSILLSEKGEAEAIRAHPDFRLFGCMNPATDVGKRDLPTSIRSRFTEIYVESPDSNLEDLLAIIDRYIGRFAMSDEWVGNDIASLYVEAKKLAEGNKIVDGSSQRPHFSIRTLTRTLLYVIDIISIYGLRRSLYEGFCMSYLTLLDLKSENILKPIIEKYTIGKLKNSKSVINTIPKAPTTGNDEYIQFKHYWLKKGSFTMKDVSHYIITPFVEKNMLNLVRASSSGRFPVLVQGPTSSGKTSMIKYLADLAGHKMVRINNHEHTDLQEYLGTYVTDDTGKLTFKEGILVEALKKGYWIVLDELNLAPTDVLEALNRLLDDNRELLIPETQEIVHPHPDFMLFATQNPPGLYGGRKVLSRAFRNRFLELHFDDIPQDELEIIIKERCQIAPSYAKKIVDVYRELIIQRSANRLFETKNSFATLRDLFRWANREAVGYDQLASNGYMLLAERCRTPEEKVVVKKVIEKIMRVSLDMGSIYGSLENKSLMSMPSHVVWTRTAKRLSVLVAECLKNNEPVLLVGETGCGKTTIVQLIAEFMKKDLISMNAHQNTETGDILGAQRPVRNRSSIQETLFAELQVLFNDATSDLETLLHKYESIQQSEYPESIIKNINDLIKKTKILFDWTDGPLIQALKEGNFFLLDEISLADDSVLERLNSVLEPERSLLLAEKGSGDIHITASTGFQFFATMNPGGDYGKKELSPALRNRFTEIWVPSMEDFNDVAMIVEQKLTEKNSVLVDAVVKFSEWFALRYGNGNASSGVISLRDILAWVDFINATTDSLKNYVKSLVQGAAMVFIDALGTNNTAYLAANIERLELEKSTCFQKIFDLTETDFDSSLLNDSQIIRTETALSCGDFKVEIDPTKSKKDSFNLSAPTTALNLMKVIRALQVNKPILLEGSPGVGKTSLIQALADATGNSLTRINLSEQTDLIDLFGSDTPGETTGEFVWRDAPFLRAMQRGEWVLLDEMNLASQSVLEGLNACLDHRGEAYIPELDKSFVKQKGFMVFAAQNPQYQGGGRKGLPKSFVNRFSVVYADSLTSVDLNMIARHLYPDIEHETINKMIQLMSLLEDEICNKKSFATLGSPWEFNLRDTLRWLSLLSKGSEVGSLNAEDFLNVIVKQRFRSTQDREKAEQLIFSIFGQFSKKDNFFAVNEDSIEANGEILDRFDINQFRFENNNSKPLQCNFEFYESFLRCVKYNWPLILTGPSNSGKTELIKMMSGLIGNKVLEFSMNADVDSMDILGGYEQIDLTRKLSYVMIKLKTILISSLCKDVSNAALSKLLDFINTNVVDNNSKFEQFVLLFNNSLPFLKHLESIIVDELKAEIVKFAALMSVGSSSVKFEWFDGMLVKAVEEGHWLILDNANLCSPSVLDRLNSLLETNGSLIINECSLEDGRPRVVKPHPNFRLFLTCNPKYGELSRAMRNRGIEIFVSELGERATPVDLELIDDFSSKTVYNAVSLCNSKDSNWAKLQDLMKMKSIDDSYAFNVLKFDQINNVSDWVNNVVQNPYNNLEDDDKLFQVVAMAKNELSNSLFNDGTLPEKVLSLQHLNSAVNNYLSKDKGAEFAMFIKGFCLFVQMSCDLDAVSKSATSGSSNKSFSFIEKSAMAYFNIDNNLNMEKSFPVYDILLSLRDITSKLFASVDDISTISNSYNNLLIKLVLIWSSMFATSSSSKKNETKLRTYQEMINDWLETIDYNLINKDYLDSIRDKFSNTIKLSRGVQITSIWKHFRKQYPTSTQSWSDYSKLIKLSKDLDNLAVEQFEETYEFINSLRSLIQLLLVDLNNGIKLDEDIFDNLNNGLIKLNDISSKFLIKRTHFFEKEFKQIYHLLLLAQKDSNTSNNNILQVATNALIPTQLQSLIQNDNTFMLHLWTFDGANGSLNYSSNDIISSTVFEDAINKSNNISKSKGFEIDQTLIDCKILLKSIIVNSSNLLNDSKTILKQKLVSWTESIINVVNINEKEVLTQEIITKFFSPVLELLSTEDVDWASLGKLFLSFGLGSILLFCPDKSYDPASKDYCENEQFLKLHLFYESIATEWSLIRKLYFQDLEPLNIENGLPKSEDLEKPSKPVVFRDGENDKSDLLFDEWTSFIDTSISENNIAALVDSFTNNDATLPQKIEIFQNNTSQFIKRMKLSYLEYSDLNDILINFIYSLKLGIDILKFDNLQQHKNYKITSTWTNKLNNIFLETEFKKNLDQFNIYLKNQTIDNFTIEEIAITLLKIIKFQSSDSEIGKSMYNQLLETLYYRWSLRRMKLEQLEEQNDGLYKYDYDVEKQAEEEFKKMFPEYDEIMSIDDHTAHDKKATSTNDEIYYNIAKTFISSFSTESADVFKTSELLLETSYISSKLPAELFMRDSPTGDGLIATIFNLNKEIDLFVKPNTNSINFYTDYSVSDSKRAIEVITKLCITSSKLLEQWPENATLGELVRTSEEFLTFPVETPVARLILKLEQIFTFVAEWEKYASSEVSLSTHYHNLTSLIVSWRKMELSTWNSLLDAEDLKLDMNLGKWWYYLFESIVVANLNKTSDNENIDESNVSGLLGSLNIFFTKSKIGEFENRLVIVKSFYNYCIINKELLPKFVATSLANIIKYYDQFSIMVKENIAASKKLIAKEVKDIILLASWKDVNIDALKQSSKKSHNKLFNQIRKYRDVINRECQTLIETGIQDTTKVNFIPFKESKAVNVRDVGDLAILTNKLKNLSSFNERASSLINVELVSKNMSKYIAKVDDFEFPSILPMASGIVDDVEYLEKETPSTYTKESKKQINSLKTSKLKLLADSIKEFKRIGYKVNFRDDIHSYLSTVTGILTKMQPFNNTEFESCDKYVFQLLDLFPKLRSVIASNEQQDIPITDLNKCLAVIENLLFDLFKNRNTMFSFATDYEKLEEMRMELEDFNHEETATIKSSSCKTQFEEVIYGIKWISEFLKMSIDIAKVCDKEVGSKIEVEKLTVFYQKFLTFGVIKSDVIKHKELSYMESYYLLIDEFKAYLTNYAGDLRFLMDSLYEFVLSVNQYELLSVNDDNISLLSIVEIEQFFRKLYSSIILSVQKVHSLLSVELSVEDDKWAKTSSALLKNTLSALHIKQVTGNLDNIHNCLALNSFTGSDALIIQNLSKFTMPLINHYYTLSTSVLNKLKSSYYNNSKATFLLSKILTKISNNGLCQPQPPSDETNEEAAGDSEAAGLGDGAADNVNNDNVEEDEDLLEDAATKNPDQKDDEKDENNDDGVQMENDFAGEMENLSDQDKDDNSDDESDENDEEEDLDEAVDDLDDDDVNAIDEKMWDEEVEEEEDNKEKDANDVPENDKNDVEADENEDQSSNQKDAEGEDNKDDDDENKEDGNDSGKNQNKELGANEDEEDLNNEENTESKVEENDDGIEESDDEPEDVGAQEDQVENEEQSNKDDFKAPEIDTMDLPDDINLESDKDEGEGEDEDDNMGLDEEEFVDPETNEAKPEEIEEENVSAGEDDVDMDEQDENAENVDEEVGEEANEEDVDGDNETDSDVDEEQDINNNPAESKAGGEDADEDADDQLEGLDNAHANDVSDKSEDQETRQAEGNEGEGADNEASSEKQDVGASGTTQEQQTAQDSEDTDINREKAKESMKQLGDVLKEYHNRKKEIQEANSEQQEGTEDVDAEDADEFEHINGETGGDNLQALGDAEKEEEIRPFDEELEISDDDKTNDIDAMDVDAGEEEDLENDEYEGDGPNGETQAAAFSENQIKSLENQDNIVDSYLQDNIESLDDLDQLVATIDNTPLNNYPPRDLTESRKLWQKAELKTNELASNLSEQLRLILEPTLATKLKGDYKTGKRLNMKRIIPYIASQFRKDKIWLRRTKPSKRTYQIMVSIDNSKSMAENPLNVELTFEAIALVTKALTQLESGGLSILKFGESSKEVIDFNTQFSNNKGEEIISEFNFKEEKTNVLNMVCESMKIFEQGKQQQSSQEELWQLQIVLSDGVCEDHDTLVRLVRRCREKKIMLVFVIIDCNNSKESIMDMSQVSYVNNKLQIKKYLDTFPFEYYVVVKDIKELPAMLSLILRQYFAQS